MLIFSKLPEKYFFSTVHRVFILALTFIILNNEKATAQTQKPNIILILGDDIGYKTLTCNGGTSYATPNLDTLAQQGMRFTQCHASPLCSPSRFMLLTGKYNFRNYIHWGEMDTTQKTIANMMKDAGYVTACYGKWQLDGGDPSVHAFGFDRYCIWNAFEQEENDPRYKSPHIYTNGAYLSTDETADKYGEDIFTDSVLSFIDSNKAAPFFIYYPMVLAHAPFSPTPDDADFLTWSDSNIINNVSDTSYYYSMIKYMDKKIGQIVDKIKGVGIEDNTVIIYLGDNGTPGKISQIITLDSAITGQKGQTNEFGTHVPLIVYWHGAVNAGTINNNLVDLTDFLPTIAGIANTAVPTNYGTLDGVTFFPQLVGQGGTPRNSIFCHFDAHPSDNKYKRWAQTSIYKLYDTSFYNSHRLFYDISNDPKEMFEMPDSTLTADQSLIKEQLLSVINNYRAQGIPLLSATGVSQITDSSALVTAKIDINGGSTVSSSGAVWSIAPNPVLSTGNHTSDTAQIGAFTSFIRGLVGNTEYYLRPYAINAAGIGYGNEVSSTTKLSAPHAITARGIDTSSFVARWNVLAGATSYRLDVSARETFGNSKLIKLNEGFDAGVAAPKGWTISAGIGTDNQKFGLAAPSLQFNSSGQQVSTKTLIGPATKLTFWVKTLAANAGSLLVEGYDGQAWTVIDNITNLPYQPGRVIRYDTTTIPALRNDIIQFRFTYNKATASLDFDDVSINYNKTTPIFVGGYNDLTVNDTSQQVTGLNSGKTYYYRVRAVNDNGTSANSNVVATSPCNPPSITALIITNVSCAGNHTGSIGLNASGIAPLAYDWTGPGGFTSSNDDINNLAAGTYKIMVTSSDGCSVDSGVVLLEPPGLSATLTANPILCTGGSTSIITSATGGTGNYHYSLSNGSTTTGPQDNNQFTVPAGTYTVIVTDDNGCSFISAAIHIDDGSQACGAIVSNAKGDRSEKTPTTVHTELNVRMFPNPSSKAFTLEFEGGGSAKVKVLVADIYGRKVYESENGVAGKISFGEGFVPGIYFVVVMQERNIKILKLIKQRD